MMTLNKNLSEIILPSFHDFHAECRNGFTHFVAKGGRNSSKSTTISIECILRIITDRVNGLVIRKVANTLQESVYEQLKEATMLLGIEHQFIFQKSPLRIINKEWGNYIIFRGADNPIKIKSIKTSNYPIAFCWFEELDEFKKEDELQVILDSILRARLPDDLLYKFFYSYNPPKRKQHWLNKKYETELFIPKNTFVHHSDYRDNRFLPDQTLDEISLTKDRHPRKYDWVYLGKPIGGGVVPFENLTFRTITDDEFKAFDNPRQGLDWGYAVDPFAMVKWHYDKTRRKIYCMNEIFGLKIQNREAAARMIDQGFDDMKTTCDSAEPKSIAEIKGLGIKKAVGAKKGPGSVETGEKWLNELEEIVIDQDRTPETAREFENIDYEVDRDGNTISRLQDFDNNSIDGTRYAFEDDIISRKITSGKKII